MRTECSILYNSVTRGSLLLAKTQAQVGKSTHDAQTDNLSSSEIMKSNVANANNSKEEDDDVVWVEKEVKLTTASKRCQKSSRSKSPKRKKYHSRSR